MKDGRGGKWANAALQKGYTHHNDCMPHEEYVKWQRDCLNEMLRIIPDDGAIFYNHKWRVQGGLLQDRQDIVSGFPNAAEWELKTQRANTTSLTTLFHTEPSPRAVR